MSYLTNAFSSAITPGTTPIIGGTDTCILFDKAGVIGEDTNLEWNYTSQALNIIPAASSLAQLGGGGGYLTLKGTSGNFPGIFVRLNTDTSNRFFIGLDGGTNAGVITFGPGGVNNPDVALLRNNVGVLSLLQGSSSASVGAAAFQVYNTVDNATSPTNYERGVFDFTTDTVNHALTIGTQKGGSGQTRNFQFVVGGTRAIDWNITNAGDITVAGNNYVGTGNVGFLVADNAADGGCSANYWRAGLTLAFKGPIDWSPTRNLASVPDTGITREIANIIAIADPGSLTTATGLRVYNTTDTWANNVNPTNYERGVFDWTTTANVLTIGTQKGGTGTLRDVKFVGSGSFRIDTTAGGTSNLIFIGPDGAGTTYNMLALDGRTTDASGFIGIAGGATGDGTLYLECQTGSTFQFVRTGSVLSQIAFATTITANAPYSWSSTTSATGAQDLGIGRISAGIMAIGRIGALTSPAGLQVYNTTDTFPGTPTNYELGIFGWTSSPGGGGFTSGTALTIGTEHGGGGSRRPVQFEYDNNFVGGFGAEGNFVSGGSATASLWYLSTTSNNATIAAQNSSSSGFAQVVCMNDANTFLRSCTMGYSGSATTTVITNGPTGEQGYNGIPSAHPFVLYTNNAARMAFAASSNVVNLAQAGVLAFSSSSTNVGAAADTGISRIAPVSSVPTIAIGNGTAADASGTIQAKTKAGAPTASDVPAGTWVLIRDTTNATTKLYYNNAGTLMTVALV